MVLSGFHYPRPLFILYENVLTSPMSANDPKRTLGGLQERVKRLFVVMLVMAVMASTQAMAFGPRHQWETRKAEVNEGCRGAISAALVATA